MKYRETFAVTRYYPLDFYIRRPYPGSWRNRCQKDAAVYNMMRGEPEHTFTRPIEVRGYEGVFDNRQVIKVATNHSNDVGVIMP